MEDGKEDNEVNRERRNGIKKRGVEGAGQKKGGFKKNGTVNGEDEVWRGGRKTLV